MVILGAGESGTGAALLAKSRGWDVFVSDAAEIKPAYADRLNAAGIVFESGGHTMDRILDTSLMVKSPGIPDKAPAVAAAKARGIEVIDEIEFAFRYLKGKVIAITGTNGKTTTTLLTYHLLKSAGLSVALAGNVGRSLASQLAEGDHDWYVIEISSFQLDGTRTFRPETAILTNITPDHLDRYDYQIGNYMESKLRLVANMLPNGTFIHHGADPLTAKALENRPVRPRRLSVSLSDATAPVHADGSEMTWDMGGEVLCIDQAETTLKGTHNILNTMMAVAAARLAGVAPGDIRAALRTFRNAPHRLEPVGTIRGVEFINDSKATNVDSVVYALGSFDRPLIWIAGGIDKGNDYGLIRDAVASKVRSLVCLGKDNRKLVEAFTGVVADIAETQDVRELVRMALDRAERGDVVLLSPACASFDLFRNYEDRGDRFRAAVQELKTEMGE